MSQMKTMDTYYQTGYRDGFIEGKSAGLRQSAYVLQQAGLPPDPINVLIESFDHGEPVVHPKLRWLIYSNGRLVASVPTEEMAHDWGSYHFGKNGYQVCCIDDDKFPDAKLDAPEVTDRPILSGLDLVSS